MIYTFKDYFWPRLEKKYRASARKNYLSFINDACSFCGCDDFLYLNDRLFFSYVDYLKLKCAGGIYTKGTVGVKIAVLCAVSRYMYEHMPADSEIVYTPFPFLSDIYHYEAYEPQILDREDIDNLLDVTKLSDYPLHLALNLTLYCGLSATEIVRLTKGSLKMQNNLYIESFGYERYIEIPAWLWDMLNNVDGTDLASPLIKNRRGLAMSVRSLEKHLAVYSKISLRELKIYSYIMMYAYGVDDKTFSRYTGSLNASYYARYKNAAAGVFPVYDYGHILKNAE